MKLIKQPNAWSCTIAAAAMVLNQDIEEMLAYIGHDGSEIVHPSLPEPMCRKGFHIQEIVDIAHCLGFSMTPIEVEPVQTPDGIHEFEIKKWSLFNSNMTRLQYYLNHFSGLLVGKARKHWHTVAWDKKRIYDPNGTIYPFIDCKIDLQIFWKIKSF